MKTPNRKAPEYATGTIGNIREKMNFIRQYTVFGRGGSEMVTLRVYGTNGGTYGPQFRSIMWTGQDVFVGEKTDGYGYNKVNAAVAYVLAVAFTADGKHEGHEPDEQIAKVFGINRNRVHCAHA